MSALYAVLSSIAYGSADFLGGVASRKHSAMEVVVTSQMVGSVFVASLLTVFGPERYTVADFLWGAAAGLVGGVGLIFFYRGLATGRMAVAAPLSAATTAFVPLVYGLIIGERPSAGAWVGVVLAILSILLVTYERTPHVGEDKPHTGALDGLIAGIGFGGFFIFISQTDPTSGVWPLVGARTASILFVFALAAGLGRRVRPTKVIDPTVAASGFLDITANALYLAAVRVGLVSLASVVTSLYPAATILLARVVLKEELTVVRITGVAMALAGIGLIATG